MLPDLPVLHPQMLCLYFPPRRTLKVLCSFLNVRFFYDYFSKKTNKQKKHIQICIASLSQRLSQKPSHAISVTRNRGTVKHGLRG